MNECEILLSYTSIEYVLEGEALCEFDRMLILSSTDGNNESLTCPSCQAVMLRPVSDEQRGLMRCVNDKCQTDLCSRCGVLYHLGRSCAQFQSELRSKTGDADEAFAELAQREQWCRCPAPKCGIHIERTEGCYHMTHLGCKGADNELKRTDFCYFCGELLVKKEGEGWRFSRNGGARHFENGVYEKCVNAQRQAGDAETRFAIGDDMFL